MVLYVLTVTAVLLGAYSAVPPPASIQKAAAAKKAKESSDKKVAGKSFPRFSSAPEKHVSLENESSSLNETACVNK